MRVSARAAGVQSLLNHLNLFDPHRNISPFSSPMDVRAVRVRPCVLDTVYITVAKDLLESVDDAQRRFGGGFSGTPTNGVNNHSRSKIQKVRDISEIYWSTSGSLSDRLMKIVREAVKLAPIIHVGDALCLPLPAHPITHIPPPPATVHACEPVTQGLISPTTRIVLTQAELGRKTGKQWRVPELTTQNIAEDDAEDTANENFYSAAEDKEDETESEDESSPENSSLDQSSEDDSEDASDDSLENIISLQAPELPLQRSAAHSTALSTTPRPGVQNLAGALTPGSTYSGYTNATTRAMSIAGCICRTRSLLQRIPASMLRPVPGANDDDLSFVFVDMNTLSKIRCFSGDWVRLEPYEPPQINGGLLIDSKNLHSIGEESNGWRLARIFGIYDQGLEKPQYPLGRKHESISLSSSVSSTRAVHMSPVLLQNLGSPDFVKLSAVSALRQSNPKGIARPPLAKEVTLRKVSTPLSTRREIQPALFAMLKQHFQSSLRILKTGDLIAIIVDEDLSRATFNIGSGADNDGEDLIANGLKTASGVQRGEPRLAWFIVDQMVREDTGEAHKHAVGEDEWGGLVMVDPLRTKTTQAGNSIQGIPLWVENNTAHWLGIRKTPFCVAPLTLRVGAREPSIQPYILSLQKRLSNLVSPASSPRAESLGMPPLAILLHSTQRRIGKSYIACAASAAVSLHTFAISAEEVLADADSSVGGGDAKTEISLRTRAERALSCGSRFTTILITHVEMLTADRMISAFSEVVSNARIVIFTTTDLEKIPDAMRSIFTHEFEMTAPDESDRGGILRTVCLQQSLRLGPSVSLEDVALKTAAMVAGDLVDIVRRASNSRDRRIKRLAAEKRISEDDLKYSGGLSILNVMADDFSEAVSGARASFSDSIGAPKIPTVMWKDVGGLADQKSSIMETISLPMAHPELFAKGIRKRSGILFYGPPGTGKTLLAKAIATEFSLNFFSVKGPELLNMYIGESEANVRRVFQRARDARPCVVFFDELDSVAPKRGNQGDSGGVMDRIVSQLLAELDGMSSGGSNDEEKVVGAPGNAGGVFVIGATNRPDLLDPALLRPGRFDKMLYLGVSSTHEQQVTIMEALTRKFALSPDVDLTRVAHRLPFTYTGADLYALCSDAMLKAITRKTKQVDVKVQEISRARDEQISTAYYFDHLSVPEDTIVMVTEDDFAAAQNELVASVR
jgi:peroxin-6